MPLSTILATVATPKFSLDEALGTTETMRIKPLRNTLMATTGISLAMIVGVCAWALLGGNSMVPEVRIPKADQQTSAISLSDAAIKSKSFEGLWNVTLQNPRNGKTAQVASPSIVKPAPVGFGILLVGTVIEPSKTLALFRDDRGAFDLKGVGQSLDLVPAGAQVENIEPELATLRYEGREVKLLLAAGTTPGQLFPRVMETMQPNDENSFNPTEPEPEPIGMMTPISPDDAVPTGEDDIFAPLPDHLNPYKLAPDPGSPMSMEVRP